MATCSRPFRRRAKGEDGFGLVEVLIAMTMLAVAIGAIITVFVASAVSLRRAGQKGTALTLADVQQYSQPISYGITSYELSQWMSVAFLQDQFRISDQFTLDAGVRYGRIRPGQLLLLEAVGGGFTWGAVLVRY